jgi:hypothetical protein
LFAQDITAAPASLAALNTAAAGFADGAALDSVIRFTFTQSALYGARTDHCSVSMSSASNLVILQAEQNATGRETGCTFTTSGLNSGSLAKPNAAFGGTNGYMSVSNFVLGNMAGASQPYSN